MNSCIQFFKAIGEQTGFSPIALKINFFYKWPENFTKENLQVFELWIPEKYIIVWCKPYSYEYRLFETFILFLTVLFYYTNFSRHIFPSSGNWLASVKNAIDIELYFLNYS